MKAIQSLKTLETSRIREHPLESLSENIKSHTTLPSVFVNMWPIWGALDVKAGGIYSYNHASYNYQ
jgi:hypothetical protein